MLYEEIETKKQKRTILVHMGHDVTAILMWKHRLEISKSLVTYSLLPLIMSVGGKNNDFFQILDVHLLQTACTFLHCILLFIPHVRHPGWVNICLFLD